MAELSLNQYNVLFLDEPTNHLDTASAKAVAEAVNNFEGAVLAISHDATFVESVATNIIQCIDDHIEIHVGFDPKHLAIQQSATVKTAKANNAEEHKERKKLRNQIKRWEREYEELENQIMELEEQIEGLDAQMFEAASDLKTTTRPHRPKDNCGRHPRAIDGTLGKLGERLAGV